ncbi:MAG: SMI1/KNR4 family protein [Ferruginibacter sp.]
MSNSSIIAIIDRHLQNWIDKKLNALPVKIEFEMTNPVEAVDHEGWQKWYPVDSTVTDTEIEELESQLNARLPVSYKLFLKHKHFYDLYISEARFSGHEIRNWKQHRVDMIFNGYPAEFLIDRGYIPFADWSDWGLLCFDTNQPAAENDYPIILWDHEYWDQYEPFSDNFQSLLVKLNAESDNKAANP